jgi:DNA-binding MarR family transcriptional regulator
LLSQDLVIIGTMRAMEHDPPYDDRERLSHLLWEVGTRTAALAEAALADTPLTPASVGLLDTIEAAPGITIAEIARLGPTTPQGVSQVVARLERDGYLERRLAGRGRAVALYVTPAGAAARRTSNAAKAALEDRLRDALGARVYEELTALLREARPVVTELDLARRAAR